jgi:hypothetical protein
MVKSGLDSSVNSARENGRIRLKSWVHLVYINSDNPVKFRDFKVSLPLPTSSSL